MNLMNHKLNRIIMGSGGSKPKPAAAAGQTAATTNDGVVRQQNIPKDTKAKKEAAPASESKKPVAFEIDVGDERKSSGNAKLPARLQAAAQQKQ
jgi:hypothetical protein